MIRPNDLILATILLHRLPQNVVDHPGMSTARLYYSATVIHVSCITPEAWMRIIIHDLIPTTFDLTIFFHPNVGEDGWVEIRRVYLDCFNSPTPPFPLEPVFWTYERRGRACLYPPRILNEWIEAVSQGRVLGFDPVPRTFTEPDSTHEIVVPPPLRIVIPPPATDTSQAVPDSPLTPLSSVLSYTELPHLGLGELPGISPPGSPVSSSLSSVPISQSPSLPEECTSVLPSPPPLDTDQAASDDGQSNSESNLWEGVDDYNVNDLNGLP